MSPFESLDYLYMPSHDVATDVVAFTDVLGGRLVFAIEAMGTRVAMIDLADGAPRVLLTDHLEGDQPILVYRVAELDQTLTGLAEHGWRDVRRLEIPQGPCASLTLPGGQRVAVYERSRPEVEEHFIGRRDF